jgi:hypothetical protein
MSSSRSSRHRRALQRLQFGSANGQLSAAEQLLLGPTELRRIYGSNANITKIRSRLVAKLRKPA